MRNEFDHLEEELIEYFIHGFMAHRDRTPQELATIRDDPEHRDAHDMWLMARTIDPFVSDETIAECIQNGYNLRVIDECAHINAFDATNKVVDGGWVCPDCSGFFTKDPRPDRTDIHTLRSALWLARQAMAVHDVPDAGARSAVDAALMATGGLETNDTPAGQAANYQEDNNE
jgi:hypothetical protein